MNVRRLGRHTGQTKSVMVLIGLCGAAIGPLEQCGDKVDCR